MKKILIVGYGTAGSAAARYTMMTNREAEVVVVDSKEKGIFHPCLMPYVIAYNLKLPESLVKEDYSMKERIHFFRGSRAEKIDPENKVVQVSTLNGKMKLRYSKLVIATGSKPFIPPISGTNLRRVFTLHTLEDCLEVNACLKEASNAVIIGGGAIGVETAFAFRKRGLNVTLIEIMNSLLPGRLDRDLAETLKMAAEENRVKVMLETRVEEIMGEEKVEGVVTDKGEIKTDMVLLSTGVKPNVQLVEETNISLGRNKGIDVNERMETNIEDIYAAGDCAESKHFLTGIKGSWMLATTSYEEGKVAGINSAGGKAIYKGALPAFISHAFGLEYGAVGLTGVEAKKLGIKTISFKYRGYTREKIFSKTPTQVKVLANREGKILGIQAIGSDVSEIINLGGFLIRKKINVAEIDDVEFSYCPPLSTLRHPLKITCEALASRVKCS